MDITRVCVIGGSGFVGSHIVHELSRSAVSVRVPTRSRERAKHLIVLPTVDVMETDVHETAALSTALRGVDAVINLAGVLHDGRGTRGFAATHVELTRKVLAACTAHGVSRYLHMSALGADPAGPSRYQRTKGEAEALVRAAALEWTIFRPSVIFGRGDRFLNLFALLQQRLPVMVLAAPDARFQPVYVEDVARAIAHSVDDRSSFRREYELCGPRAYTLRELVALAGRISGHPRPIIGLNPGLSYLQALVMEFLPGQLMTRDNYASMKRDNVCSAPFPFGIEPQAIEAVAPSYLGRDFPRARYSSYRDRARGQPGR